jgi:CRP-like cAMP-binding protein
MKKILLNHPLFAQMSKHEIDHILSCMDSRQQRFAKGSFIFLAEESYPKLGILFSGKAQVIKENIYGDKMIIGTLKLGSLFGETYACMGLPKIPVSVEAIEDCIVLLLDINLMLRTCNKACQFHQRLISNLLKIIATKNMILTRKMSYITHKTIRGRLLAFLEDQAERAKSNIFEIPFNRNELADYLCVDRSAMSRELGRMKKEGLLDFDRKTFRLQV